MPSSRQSTKRKRPPVRRRTCKMPESRLEKCRESYQIVDCKVCGLPTTWFNSGGICGGCTYKNLTAKEAFQVRAAKAIKELSGG